MDVIGALHCVATLGGFWEGLDFRLPYLFLVVEGHEIFLEQYPKVVDVFLGPIKHESSVDVAVPCDGVPYVSHLMKLNLLEP